MAKDELDMFCSQDCKEEALADLDNRQLIECLSCQIMELIKKFFSSGAYQASDTSNQIRYHIDNPNSGSNEIKSLKASL